MVQMGFRERGWGALRLVYGLFFLSTGVWIWLHILTGRFPPPVQPTAEAAAFMAALSASGFFDPLLGASYLVGGGALLTQRTAPLGLVILAPAVAVILFFDIMLAGQTVWPVSVAAWFGVLVWRYRAGLRPLWEFSG
jgi:hypothetical protein